jgi:maltooligosyltrehalose synthase
VAFARGEPGQRAVTITGRFFAASTEGRRPPIADAWRDTTVALHAPVGRARYHEALTGRPLAAATRDGAIELALTEVFETLPIALIVEEATP